MPEEEFPDHYTFWSLAAMYVAVLLFSIITYFSTNKKHDIRNAGTGKGNFSQEHKGNPQGTAFTDY
jgi:hypothetical protein